jgi:HlyD family secretion protein
VRQVRDNAQILQNVVTYDAVIDVGNEERLLKPSMTASVTFVYATRDSALRVPNAAMRFKPDPATIAAMTGASLPSPGAGTGVKADERVVWVLRGGRAVPVIAHMGISGGDSTEAIGDEVREGDEVVTEANVIGAAAKASP